MKKSILFIGLSLCSIAPYAAYSAVSNPVIIFDVNHKSKEEIDPQNLPDRIKQTISNKHQEATISRAYKWHRGNKLIGYEVVITQSDKKDQVVKFDKHGKLVRGIDN